MGAVGRDFYNFNCLFRHREDVEVAAFTGAQIPDIEGRIYPPELTGPHCPDGIAIRAGDDLDEIVPEQEVDQVRFCYSTG